VSGDAPPAGTGGRGDRPAEPEGGIARILLVDDLAPLLELHRRYLRRTTCRVMTARTGGEALALCRRERPDLIFLDAGLSGTDGIAACRALKADPDLRAVPVVLLASAEEREDCLRAGCEAVLAKPVTQEAFLAQVRRFVRLRERQETRVPASLRVAFTVGRRSYDAFTRDVSPQGLFLKTARPFAIGTRLRLAIALPGGTVVTDGEVRRVVEKQPAGHLLAGIGVLFVDPPAATTRALADFIAGRLARDR
jgi:uncharacterized protein (TIGR02266 family)